MWGNGVCGSGLFSSSTVITAEGEGSGVFSSSTATSIVICPGVPSTGSVFSGLGGGSSPSSAPPVEEGEEAAEAAAGVLAEGVLSPAEDRLLEDFEEGGAALPEDELRDVNPGRRCRQNRAEAESRQRRTSAATSADTKPALRRRPEHTMRRDPVSHCARARGLIGTLRPTEHTWSEVSQSPVWRTMPDKKGSGLKKERRA